MSTLEINGHQVYVGKRVNVKWLHEWYEGTVLEIGPQKQLYKVEESITGQTILLHSTQMRLIDTTKPTDKQCCIGAKVAYYDNDLSTLISGIILDNNVEGMVLVKWQRNSESNENINWFELSNIAPVITNVKFGLDNIVDDEAFLPLLPTSTSPASLDDVLENHRLHRSNELFDGQETSIFQNKLPDISQLTKDQDSWYHVKSHRTSVSMKNFYSKNIKKDQREAKLNRYMQNQAALLEGKLDQSLLPVAWNYHSETKGIPHHPTSKFFLYSRPIASIGGRQAPRVNPLSRIRRTYSAGGEHLGLTKSPTLSTEAASEPGPLRSSKSGPLLQRFTGRQKNKVKVSTEVVVEDYDTEAQVNQLTNAGPVITSSSKPKILGSAGSTVILYCEVISRTPVSYEWRKNGKPLTHNDERVAFPSPGHLQLYNLTMADAGEYQCIASNEGGSTTYTCKLSIENETIRQSFSCLDELAAKPQSTGDLMFKSDAETLDANNFLSLAPTYDDLPQITPKWPSSQSDQRKKKAKKQAIEQQEKPKKMTKGVSVPILLNKRKAHKSSQRQVNDAFMEGVDNYLEGYGEDYGTPQEGLLEDHPKLSKSKAKSRKKEIEKSKKKKSKSFSSFGFGKSKNGKAKSKSKMAGAKNETLEQTSKKTDSESDDEYEMQQFKLEIPQPPEIHILEIQDDEMSCTEDLEQNTKSDDNNKQEEIGEIVINEMAREEGEGAEVEEMALELENANSLDTNEGNTYTINDFPRDDSVNHWKDTLYDHETLEIDLKGMSTHTPKLKKASSKDSINAHASYDNLEVDSEASIGDRSRESGVGRSGNVDLPIEKEDYTEAVLRLQQSHDQYENERFGKSDNGNEVTTS